METLPFHPIADVFPLMGGDDFRSLVEDIRKHGLLEPIILHEGQILDGRNRYRACREAGVAVRSQEWQGEGGSPAVFVWSKNAERRQLTTGQRALAAQTLMPHLEAEAKERQRLSPGRPRDKGDGIFDHLYPDLLADIPTPSDHRHPRAADYAAKLAGVNPSTIYQVKRLVKRAKVDPEAAALLDQVKAGTMSVWSTEIEGVFQQSHQDEQAAARRRRSPLAVVATPPAEGAHEAAKARHTSRPVRALADHLVGMRLDMERQGLVMTQDALDAWWEGVETREWEQIQESVAWFEQNCEQLLKFVHYKMTRNSVPPMVKVIERENQKQERGRRA